MNPLIKKTLLIVIGFFLFISLLAFIADVFIMPWYVDSKEIVVPNIVGKSKTEVESILKDNSLNPVFSEPRFSNDQPVDYVIYQKPKAGSIVKENRRVYAVISGGNPLTKMPNLINKTLRDAKVTIERLGLILGNVKEVKSEEKANTVVDQYPEEGTNIEKGTKIDLKISYGPNIGMVRVPDLVGMSYSEAEITIRQNSLAVGKINYQNSPNMLPNTVVAQYPSKNKLINIGETIDLFITKSQN